MFSIKYSVSTILLQQQRETKTWTKAQTQAKAPWYGESMLMEENGTRGQGLAREQKKLEVPKGREQASSLVVLEQKKPPRNRVLKEILLL